MSRAAKRRAGHERADYLAAFAAARAAKVEATVFRLTVTKRSAEAIALKPPEFILLRADKVIEKCARTPGIGHAALEQMKLSAM